MPIVFKSEINQPIKKEVKVSSFKELIQTVRPEPVVQPRVPLLKAQTKPLINKDDNTIRPNHIEDESVVYKNSGYVKDLLGEEQ